VWGFVEFVLQFRLARVERISCFGDVDLLLNDEVEGIEGAAKSCSLMLVDALRDEVAISNVFEL
jgi:hypothetical protein